MEHLKKRVKLWAEVRWQCNMHEKNNECITLSGKPLDKWSLEKPQELETDLREIGNNIKF
jgi:hypothetical protein